jgi:hypothetical protein
MADTLYASFLDKGCRAPTNPRQSGMIREPTSDFKYINTIDYINKVYSRAVYTRVCIRDANLQTNYKPIQSGPAKEAFSGPYTNHCYAQ